MSAIEPSEAFALRVCYVVHRMPVAGAEMLIVRMIKALEETIAPSIVCLDGVGELGEQLQSQGVPVYCTGRSEGLDPGLPRRMARILRRLRPDIVHAQQYTPAFYSALAKSLIFPRPALILTEHGRHWPDVVSAKRQRFNRWILDRLIDGKTAVCQYSATAVAENEHLHRANVAVIPNGVDTESCSRLESPRSQLCADAKLDPERRYVLCVARFHPVKGHRTLIAAFSRTAKTLGDVDLLLAGDGEERAALERQVRDAGIENRVIFLGVRNDVRALMSIADVFCMTSVNEAASLTVLEAMACQLPIVLTDVGGNSELVRHGIDGLLVPRADDEACSSALCKILENPDLAQRLGTSGRERVEQVFSFRGMVEQYRDLYLQAAAGRTRRRR